MEDLMPTCSSLKLNLRLLKFQFIKIWSRDTPSGLEALSSDLMLSSLTYATVRLITTSMDHRFVDTTQFSVMAEMQAFDHNNQI